MHKAQSESDIKNLSSISQFQRNPATTSERYDFIDTRKVLEQLADHGWLPVAANQAKVRKLEREGFQKHNIMLENAELNALLPTIGKPQMLYQSAHDGTSASKMLAAFKILVCSNGAVSHSGDIGEVRVMHQGFNEERFKEALRQFMARLPRMVESVEEWQGISMTQQDAYLLAQQAIELRFDPVTDSFGNPTNTFPVKPELVVQSRRWGEKPTTLWKTFNNLQENLIEKGIRGGGIKNANGRRIPIAAVRGVDSNTKLNRGLWALTKHMADLKLGREPSVEIVQ